MKKIDSVTVVIFLVTAISAILLLIMAINGSAR